MAKYALSIMVGLTFTLINVKLNIGIFVDLHTFSFQFTSKNIYNGISPSNPPFQFWWVNLFLFCILAAEYEYQRNFRPNSSKICYYQLNCLNDYNSWTNKDRQCFWNIICCYKKNTKSHVVNLGLIIITRDTANLI